MRLIDADRLKDIVEYACLQHEDTEKWAEWFKQVIDGEPTVCDIEQIRAEIEKALDSNSRCANTSINSAYCSAYEYVLAIIDKHIKGDVK